MKVPAAAVVTGVVSVALSLSACTSSGSSSAGSSAATSPAASGSATASSAMSGSAMSGSAMSSSGMSGSAMSGSAGASAMTGQFGPGCAQVPSNANNPGSFEAMAKVPVATAASGNPMLSTLVKAVGAAGLVDTLNSANNITVFAPDNAAFAKIPAKTLKKVLADKKTLTSILTYHVVPGKLSPAELAGVHKTLEGDEVTVTGSGTDFTVGDASVVCGNVQTANATVYIIDSVLMPKS
jgi:uncharacterized surface protein with fasciclin (FAS1) repeats